MRFILIISTFFIVLVSCSKTDILSEEWEEKGYDAETEIKHGIPAFEGTLIDYKRDGETVLKVKLGEPIVADVADKPEEWGYFQFPNIYRSQEGTLVATWNMAADAVASYGKGKSGVAVSHDGGKTWISKTGEVPVGGGTELPNGDRIQIRTPTQIIRMRKVHRTIPQAVGSSLHTDKCHWKVLSKQVL